MVTYAFSLVEGLGFPTTAVVKDWLLVILVLELECVLG
tara:strand:- start:366 stop:479 length:114 start_codon:yes stop_codon:yes gene_type:complete